jgi:hypothetical protein
LVGDKSSISTFMNHEEILLEDNEILIEEEGLFGEDA